MDIGTILLIVTIVVGIIDTIIMIVGPRLKDYETISYGLSLFGWLSSTGAVVWMAVLLFTDQFQYVYIWQVTSTDSNLWLKLSGIWAGQSGSLLFWTFLSFTMYFLYRFVMNGYEDDVIVSRASILMVFQAVLIAINALLADPFRVFDGIPPNEGLGLNPLLRTFWNLVHPPPVFIGYALLLVPFSIKLAGFTVRSEDRKSDPIPVMERLSSSTTLLSWIFLSIGIVVGGYWAYIVLGWGGYWAWDPVETTSLIPWLLLTAYYHAKPILKNNDVLRDSLLVFGYVTVVFATWVTRSGILSSVHGFATTIVSMSMLLTLLFNLILASLVTVVSGYRDLEDDEDESEDSDFNWREMLSIGDLRAFTLKIAFAGLLIVIAFSVIGVALPAVINLQMHLSGVGLDDMVAIGPPFFWLGFYVASFCIITSAFYCMGTSMISIKKKNLFVLVLVVIGAALGAFSFFTDIPAPTGYWLANLLVPLGAGAVAYMIVVFARLMIGKDTGTFTMRKVGRVMLHLGMVMLLLGVIMSENVIYESNQGYTEDDIVLIGNDIWVQVKDINLLYWNGPDDFEMQVTVWVIEGTNVVGMGVTSIKAYLQWGMVAHTVYVQTTIMRDVFIALTGFTQVVPGQYSVSLHVKILPLVSFVWGGSFFMVAAMLPIMGVELGQLRRTFREKSKHLYDEVEPIATE